MHIHIYITLCMHASIHPSDIQTDRQRHTHTIIHTRTTHISIFVPMIHAWAHTLICMVASEARADSAPRFQIGAITRAAWAMGRLQRLRLWRVGRLAKRWESQVDVGKKSFRFWILRGTWVQIQQDSKRSQGTMFHHIPHGWSGCATHSHPQPSIPHCDEVLRCRWWKGMANASDILGG